jgi:predicted ATPase
MEGKRLLRKLRLANFLSYGPEGTEIELQPLNVLIGPNGSGKSNLIEAISLLKAAPTDISAPLRAGGIPNWCWKGANAGEYFQLEIEAFTESRRSAIEGTAHFPLNHLLEFYCSEQTVLLARERIADPFVGKILPPTTLFDYDSRKLYSSDESLRKQACILNGEPIDIGKIDRSQSILSQIMDPVRFSNMTELGRSYKEIQLFRECTLGPRSLLRGAQRADEPASFLLGDGRNLWIVLNDLLNRPVSKRLLLSYLKRFYDGVEDITSKVYANTIETYFHEKYFTEATPSLRFSDGTLRYLYLLTILCHPDPPPLICIEEPEIGFHPDVLPIIAELLIEASQRMQLIVTTHSDILVSALSEVPEAVVVCERDNRGSHLRRLDSDALKAWLKKYSLGDLWLMGELGGSL